MSENTIDVDEFLNDGNSLMVGIKHISWIVTARNKMPIPCELIEQWASLHLFPEVRAKHVKEEELEQSTDSPFVNVDELPFSDNISWYNVTLTLPANRELTIEPDPPKYDYAMIPCRGECIMNKNFLELPSVYGSAYILADHVSAIVPYGRDACTVYLETRKQENDYKSEGCNYTAFFCTLPSTEVMKKIQDSIQAEEPPKNTTSIVNDI